MKNVIIFMLLFYSLCVSGQDTLSHIYGGCIYNELKLANDDSCPQGIFFKYENDSLTIFGTIGANCCGTHMALIKSNPDTIFISTIDTGMLCTCGCAFCFSIKIPASIIDTIVSLNGTAYNTLKNASSGIDKHSENYIKLIPNPAKDKLTVVGDLIEDLTIIELIDSRGVFIKAINTNGEDYIELDMSNLRSGVYFVRLTMKNHNSFTRTIIKE